MSSLRIAGLRPLNAASGSNPGPLRGQEPHRHPLGQIQKTPLARGLLYLAEREGFEPSVRLKTVHSLSRRAHSTALAPLQFDRYILPPDPLTRIEGGISYASLRWSPVAVATSGSNPRYG